MENYKIRVNNEAESKEAQGLFFELGYEWKYKNIGKNYHADNSIGFLYADNGCITTGDKDHGYDFFKYRSENNKLVTLPKLRDLVVLKRNDVKDANCIDKKREAWYLASDGTYYAWQYRKLCWDTESDACVKACDIKAITQPQDPALISGAEAHKALLAGENVQYSGDGGEEHWDTALNCNIGVFLNQEKFPNFKFRIVPRTIKIELELPKPFEPKEDCHVYILDDGKTDGYRRYFYEVHGDKGNEFIGIWKTEDEIKQVVEQLRKIKGAV